MAPTDTQWWAAIRLRLFVERVTQSMCHLGLRTKGGIVQDSESYSYSDACRSNRRKQCGIRNSPVRAASLAGYDVQPRNTPGYRSCAAVTTGLLDRPLRHAAHPRYRISAAVQIEVKRGNCLRLARLRQLTNPVPGWFVSRSPAFDARWLLSLADAHPPITQCLSQSPSNIPIGPQIV